MSYAWIKFWHGDNWGFWHCFHYYRNFTLSIKPNVHDTKNGGLLIVLHVRVHICFFLITNRIQLVFQHRLERRFSCTVFFFFNFFYFFERKSRKTVQNKKAQLLFVAMVNFTASKIEREKEKSVNMYVISFSDWLNWYRHSKGFPFFQTFRFSRCFFYRISIKMATQKPESITVKPCM